MGWLVPNRWFVLPAQRRGPTTHEEQPVTLALPVLIRVSCLSHSSGGLVNTGTPGSLHPSVIKCHSLPQEAPVGDLPVFPEH